MPTTRSPRVHQDIGDVEPDKAGRAGHKNSHGGLLAADSGRSEGQSVASSATNGHKWRFAINV
jgi:hypothetical protein